MELNNESREFLLDITKEITEGALAGDETLLEFLSGKMSEVMDSVVAEILSNPEGDIWKTLRPGLESFCRKKALRLLEEFLEESKPHPIRKAREDLIWQ